MTTEILVPYAKSGSDEIIGYIFWCPGCETNHHFVTKTGEHPKRACWSFNGDMDKPSFSPSLLLHSHKTLDRDDNVTHTPTCHLFLRDGQIQFLTDCTHKLAGKTVPLEPEPPFQESTA